MRSVNASSLDAAPRRPQGGGYRFDAERAQISSRRWEHRYRLADWRPDHGIGWPEKQDATGVDRGGQVGDAAIVPDEDGVFEQRTETRQRQMLRELNALAAPRQSQDAHALFIGFT